MYIKFILLKEVPLLRITLILILGVLFGKLYPSFIGFSFSSALLIILLSIIILARKQSNPKHLYRSQNLLSLSLFFALVLLGYLLGFTAQKNLDYNHYLHQQNQNHESIVQIQLTAPIEIKNKSVKVLGEIQASIKNNSTLPLTGKLICYLAKDSLSKSLKIQDVIHAVTKIQSIDAPKNPKEFDYQKYLSNQAVFGTCYIGKEQWYLHKSSENQSFISLLNKCRSYLSQHLKSYVKGEREQQIALAILIGEKNDLDNETKRIYAKSGAMHILAVSGLHVGIVYLLFSYGLFFLNSKKLKWLKPPILILLLWLYALLSGASPSVLRATTMFSFIALGQAFNRHVNIYNMLAASALVLIVINPLIIFELGFQLSYAAVIGILFFYRKIYGVLSSTNYFIDKIWSLSAVSIAAQLSTLPLSLLYFHQFPNLFLLSNLVVIPAAVVIVYLGMVLLICSFSPFLSKYLGFALEQIIYGLNEFIVIVDHLPFAATSNIHFTFLACILSYAFIACFSLALIHRKKELLFLSLCFALIGFASISLEKYNSKQEKSLLIYNVPQHSAIELKHGLNLFTLFDTKLYANQGKINYHIQAQQTSYMYHQMQQIERTSDFNFFLFANKAFLILNENFKIPQENINIDYLIVSQQNKLYLQDLHQKVKAKKIIFDSSNNPNQYYYWKKDCESLNLDCYFVSDSFAYKEKLP